MYLPTHPTADLRNFSSPLLNLSDTFVHGPFFGANYWTAIVRPVAGGGIPPAYQYVELRMTFREGGAYDYHTVFEQIKERLYHALSLARDEGRVIGNSAGLASVDMANVHLEQLPAYEPAREITDRELASEQRLQPASRTSPTTTRDSGVDGMRTPSPPKPSEEIFAPPNEPPPGYAETQAQAVGNHLEQQLRDEAGRN